MAYTNEETGADIFHQGEFLKLLSPKVADYITLRALSMRTTPAQTIDELVMERIETQTHEMPIPLNPFL